MVATGDQRLTSIPPSVSWVFLYAEMEISKLRLPDPLATRVPNWT